MPSNNEDKPKLFIIYSVIDGLTLFHMKGAIMARMTIFSLTVSPVYGLRLPKFMTLFLFLFEWSNKSHFSNLFLKILKNGKHFLTVLTSKGPPFRKKIENFEKLVLFFKKSYFFFLNLHCLFSKHSFVVYNSHLSKNFEF